MHMKVVDFLAAFGAGVDHHAKAAFRIGVAALLLRQPGCERKHVAQQGAVFGLHLGHGRDVLFRQHQEVDGRTRMDVMKGKDLVVLLHLARGNLAGNDFAEKAVGIVHVSGNTGEWTAAGLAARRGRKSARKHRGLPRPRHS